MNARVNNKKLLATKLLTATVMLSIVFSFVVLPPYPANAQIPGAYVPTAEVPILPVGASEIATGAATSKLNIKSIADDLVTRFLKTVINLARNMVLEWITNGRFDKPVFSLNFSADARKIAENAARTALGELSGINFCQGFDVTRVPGLSLNLRLNLECSLPREKQGNSLDWYLHPEKYTERDRQLALEPENTYPWAFAKALETKAQAEANAVSAFVNEYIAGQGFLGIRDESGRVKTPGSYVAKLVMESQITQPLQETAVANTVQQAIADIVNTAVRVSIERGLNAAFSGGGGGGGEWGGGAAAPAPPPEKPVISRKINSFIEHGRNFIPAGIAAGGISEREVNSINSIITTMTDLQVKLGVATDPEVIRSINANVDSLGDQLELTIASTRLCVQPDPPAICPAF